MADQGCEVVLQSSSFRIPLKCASCGGPQQTTRTAKKTVKQGNWTTTRSFQIPYCGPCAARAQATWMKGLMFAGITVVLAAAFSAIGFAAPGLPAPLLIGLPVVLSLGFAIVAMTALGPKAPPAPAMAKGEAVKLVKFSGSMSTLYCVNPHWGAEFAQMNGVQPLPKSRSMFFGAGTLTFALVAAPLFAGGAWFFAHPRVHIDNAGTQALQIWLDGKKSIVVPVNTNGAVPPAIFVPKGKHKFGWSKEGEAAPEATVDANVTMNDAHLYNPEETGCYWLVADSYGAASVMGVQQGPQPVQEFYSFDKVDTWFADNPQSISVQSGQGGGTRVALQRAKACMYLAEHGCSAEDRDKFIACEKSATDEASFKKCEDEVTCGNVNKGGEASAKGSTAPAHAAGHTPPHPRRASRTAVARPRTGTARRLPRSRSTGLYPIPAVRWHDRASSRSCRRRGTPRSSRPQSTTSGGRDRVTP